MMRILETLNKLIGIKRDKLGFDKPFSLNVSPEMFDLILGDKELSVTDLGKGQLLWDGIIINKGE